MLSFTLTNFEIRRYYQKEQIVNCVYSRNNLPKVKDETCVINLDEQKLNGTHWIALYVNGDNVTYLIALELSTFQKKLKNSQVTKIS